MSHSEVDEWRRKRRQIADVPPPRGADPEALSSILPRVMHAIATRAILDGTTREAFLAEPEQALTDWLGKAARRDGEFNARIHLEVLMSWIHDQPSIRQRMRAWMGRLPRKCGHNQRQRPFLVGMSELLESFSEPQERLFTA